MHVARILLIACVSMMSMLLVHFSGRIGSGVEKDLTESCVQSVRSDDQLDITLEEDWLTEDGENELVDNKALKEDSESESDNHKKDIQLPPSVSREDTILTQVLYEAPIVIEEFKLVYFTVSA